MYQFKHWAQIAILGLIWGSSFLLMKVATQEISSVETTGIRMATAGLLAVIYSFITKLKFNNSPRTVLLIFLLSLTNIIIPFIAITYGVQKTSSSLGAVLIATTPMFTYFIDFLFTRTIGKASTLLGLITGLVGVYLVIGGPYIDFGIKIRPFLALLFGPFCYATSIHLLNKYLMDEKPMALACATSFISGTLFLIYLIANQLPDTNNMTSLSWASSIVLGAFNTFVAYLLYYRILPIFKKDISLVTYIVPVSGVLLGHFILGEKFLWFQYGGMGLVLLGLYLVQAKKTQEV